jgi:SAM-dependent methyltransferase
MTLVERGVAKLRRVAGGLYAHGIETAISLSRGTPSALDVTRLSSEQEYLAYTAHTVAARSRQREAEQGLAQECDAFRTPGFCYVCARWTRFRSSWAWSHEAEGRKQMNWREHLRCPNCDLNNRMRAAIHLANETHLPLETLHAYATEQITPLFRQLERRCLSIVGSEYLGDSVPLGACNAAGILNQDLTRLTFQDEQFDLILSFEVFEHVPNYVEAFKECARVLKTGGTMVFSVPFSPHWTNNLVRARLRGDQTVEHLLPPEYHGDPLSREGCLCFQSFGWEMLEQVRQSGFARVSALLYYSADYGYLGENQIQFLAAK